MEKYLEITVVAVLVILVGVCAYTDIKCRKIYNAATLPAVFCGLALNYLAGGINEGRTMNLYISLLGIVGGMGIFILPYLAGWFHGGDVKLMAAVGALVGWPYIMSVTFFIVLVGAAMAVIVMLWHNKFWSSLKSIPGKMLRIKAPEQTSAVAEEPPLTIPYGLAICFGTVWALIMPMVVPLVK
ncbi:MAG: prepilin peptidase [Planctomycetes bacterium]|nr:prepilin peptidase [Planctomycetota bacterium]